jgi:peptide/nickel transport system substrate-binding protein
VDVEGRHGGRYITTVRSDPRTWNVAMGRETSTTDLTNGLLFEGFARFNRDTQENEPLAAASWERNPEGTSWTFHLRRGARWSYGQTFTADVLLLSS